MATNETTTKFKVDISDLKKNITEANRQIRLANAEFKAAASGMDDWEHSTDGVSQKLGSLRSVLTNQNKILDSYKKQLEEIEKEYGENSKEADNMRIKIANQTTQVNKTASEIKKYEGVLDDLTNGEKDADNAADDLSKGITESGDAAEKSKDGFTVLKGALASLAAAGIQAAASAVRDLARDTWEATKSAAAFADDITTLSEQTGISRERLQEFKYMEDMIDVSTETMTGSMAKLIRNMSSARDGSGAAADAFATLGVSVTDANGNLRNNQDVFNDTIDALAQVSNETERDALAMSLFGKSAQDLNPLIEAGGERIAELTEEAHNMGYVMSEESLDSLNDVQDGLDRFTVTLDGVKRSLVATFSGEIVGIIEPVTDAIAQIPEAFKTGDFSGVLDSFGSIFEGILSRVAELAPSVVSLLANLTATITTTVMDQTPNLITAAGEVLQALFNAIGENLPTIIEKIPEFVTGIVSAFTEQLPLVLAAGADMINSINDGINQTLPVLVASIPQIITDILNAITTALPILLQSGADVLNAIVQGLVDTIPVLTDTLPQVIDTIMGVLMDNEPIILDAATTLFMAIIDSLPKIISLLTKALPVIVTTSTNILIKSLPLLIQAAEAMFKGIIDALPTIVRLLAIDLPKLVASVTTTLIAQTPLIIHAGEELFMGLVSAIPTILLEIGKATPKIIKAVVDGLKDGIADMSDVGKNLIKGVWDGMTSNTDWFKSRITEWVGNVVGFLKKLFKIHSPSGLMRDEIGKMLGLGVGVGFVDSMDEVERDMKASLGGMVEGLADGLNVDTSSIVKGSASALRSSVYGEGGAIIGGGQTVNNYSFVQNNTSPKALSRLDIYRQTKNQLQFARGV